MFAAARVPLEAAVKLIDTLGRPLHDLRVSVTDQCNFRCGYCMPKEIFDSDYPFLKREQLLSFEEIEHLARIFVGLGVEKIRLTGGEPLLRRDIDSQPKIDFPFGLIISHPGPCEAGASCYFIITK